MAATQLLSVSNTKVKVRWQEPYVSEALNRQLAALGRGAIRGFRLEDSGTNYLVNLTVDDELSDSLARFIDEADAFALTYRETAQLQVDLTAMDSTAGVVAIYAVYAVSAATTIEVRWYPIADIATAQAEALILGYVNVPAGGNFGSTDITDQYRHEPGDMLPAGQIPSDLVLDFAGADRSNGGNFGRGNVSGNGAVTVSSNYCNAAARGIGVDCTGGGTIDLMLGGFMTKAGRAFRCSFASRRTTAVVLGGGTLKLEIRWFTSGSAANGTSVLKTFTDGSDASFVDEELWVVAPSNSAFGLLVLTADLGSGAGVVYMDYAAIRKLRSPTHARLLGEDPHWSDRANSFDRIVLNAPEGPGTGTSWIFRCEDDLDASYNVLALERAAAGSVFTFGDSTYPMDVIVTGGLTADSYDLTTADERRVWLMGPLWTESSGDNRNPTFELVGSSPPTLGSFVSASDPNADFQLLQQMVEFAGKTNAHGLVIPVRGIHARSKIKGVCLKAAEAPATHGIKWGARLFRFDGATAGVNFVEVTEGSQDLDGSAFGSDMRNHDVDFPAPVSAGANPLLIQVWHNDHDSLLYSSTYAKLFCVGLIIESTDVTEL